MVFARYNDPDWATLARAAEVAHDLPSGILDAIRLFGERSNSNQVSEAGAKSVYQFIPATRRGILKNYGVDAYSGPEGATEAAANLLAENLRRSKGDVTDAVSMYHGGLNRRNWGPRTRAYTERVMSGMPVRYSNYGTPPYLPEGDEPMSPGMQAIANQLLAPEPPTQPTPIPGDPGPSQSAPAASPLTSHKRGGILGSIGRALGSVFMPNPDSLYAAALRGGVWDARANQQQYREGQQAKALQMAQAQYKLKQMMTKGDYTVVGNNVLHTNPDGTAEFIPTPVTKSDKERLLERWSTLPDGNAEKAMIERILEGANADPVLQSRERVARERSGATVQSARIRSTATQNRNTLPPLPPGFTVVK